MGKAPFVVSVSVTIQRFFVMRGIRNWAPLYITKGVGFYLSPLCCLKYREAELIPS